MFGVRGRIEILRGRFGLKLWPLFVNIISIKAVTLNT